MKILFLTRHEWKGASSRYRSVQFFPHFEAAGHSVLQRPFFTDAYLDSRAAGKSPVLEVLKRYAARLWTLRRDLATVDAVVIEKELFPFLPAATEALARRKGVPVVYDYDDAIWHAYERRRLGPFGAVFAGKIARVVQKASHIVTGSRYLQDQVTAWSPAPVTLLPTCVPSARYLGQGLAADKTVDIVWIGSMSTGRYLLELFPVFARLHHETGARLRAIGFSPDLLDGAVPDWLEIQPWAHESELDLMASARIGIMPIPDTPFERGKCGFKLVQYMGLGLATVASPVGENRFIVQDGETGLHATTPEEWYTALSALLGAPETARAMGEKGRAVFLGSYSTEAVAKKWIALLEALTGKAA